jgi:methylmalonyl-CoA carboxyltransferase large subunit
MDKHIAIEPEIEELLQLKREVASLTEKVNLLTQTMAELTKRLTAPPAPVPAEPAASPGEKTVSPELLVIITAAVTAFLGKKVRIRSARILQSPYEIVNAWSQQGRVSVQASHLLYRER